MKLAVLLVLAVAFRAAEFAIPTPVPWLRLGIANGVVLFTLVALGPRAALLVNLGRIILASLLFGTLLSPGFWLSLSAGTSSCLVMIAAWLLLRKWVSCVGVSVIGSYAHILTQFLVAYWLFVRHPAIVDVMPYFLFISLVTGIATGLLAQLMLVWARRHGMVQV